MNQADILRVKLNRVIEKFKNLYRTWNCEIQTREKNIVMKLKKTYILMLTVSFFCMTTLCGTVFADNYTLNGKSTNLPKNRIFLDGTEYFSEEISPLNINNRVYVAVQDLKGLVNANVKWNKKAEEIRITRNNVTIRMKKGNTFYYKNNKKVSFDKGTKVQIVNNRSLIPLSFAIKEFDLDYKYDGSNKILYLTSFSEGTGSNLFEEEMDMEDGRGVGVKPIEIQPIPPADPMNPSTPNQEKQKTVTLVQNQDNDTESLAIQMGDTVNYDVSVEGNRISVSFASLKPLNMQYKKTNLIDDIKIEYDSVGNVNRMEVVVKSSVDMNQVTVNKKNREILIQYKEKVVTSSTYSYEKDKSSAVFSLPLTRGKNISVNKSGSQIVFSVDKSSLNGVPVDTMGKSDDRLLNGIRVLDKGNSYQFQIDLKDRVSYEVTNSGSSGTFTLKLIKNSHTTPIISIDPGHGGKDSGAVKNGYREKDLNLEVSSFLVPALRSAGYEVITSRDTDVYPTLDERANLANQTDSDLFISIHHNSGESNVSAKGIETHYYNSQDSKRFAEIVQRKLIQATGAKDRGIKNTRLLVVRKTNMPGVLLELGFMTNLDEVSKISDPSYQKLMSDAIVEAVNEYFGR